MANQRAMPSRDQFGLSSDRTKQLGFAVVLGVILLVGLAILGFAVHDSVFAIDLRLGADLRSWNAGFVGSLFRVIDLVASAPVWDSGVLLLGVVLWLARYRLGALIVVSGLSAEVATALVKHLVDRSRPPGAAVSDLVATASFPSGHVVRAFVILGLLVFLAGLQYPRWRYAFPAGAIGLLLILSLARVGSGEHWPSDILGSLLLGAFWLDILLVVWDCLLHMDVTGRLLQRSASPLE